MRVNFCGSITGSVAVRKDETEQEAIRRAEIQILEALSRTCRSLAQQNELFQNVGPNVGLEPLE